MEQHAEMSTFNHLPEQGYCHQLEDYKASAKTNLSLNEQQQPASAKKDYLVGDTMGTNQAKTVVDGVNSHSNHNSSTKDDGDPVLESAEQQQQQEDQEQQRSPTLTPASGNCSTNKQLNDTKTESADAGVKTSNTNGEWTNSESKRKPPPLTITMESNNQDAQINEPKSPLTPGPSSADYKKRQLAEKERKIGHRRIDEEGQVTYKKIQTTQIMGSIQLGIGYAVGSLASKPERDLLMKDFMELENVSFPREGSNITPAHHYNDFRFKIYAPTAFRYFRDLFGIKPDNFLLSLCNKPLRELSNPGASGSVFYLTPDDDFIIKTIQHKEAEFLLKLLPGYYMNLNQNPRTLLPKFFGQYCYVCGGKNVRIIVMNNLLPSNIKLHEKYDLKGSTYMRKASKYERKKESPTYKDLDFMEHHPKGISIDVDTYSALMKTMQQDCRVLESFKIMDYSLLIGVHYVDRDHQQQQAELAAQELGGHNRMRDSESSDKPTMGCLKRKSINKKRIAAYSTTLESIQADIVPIDPCIPDGGIPARSGNGERMVLYIGIIDILQSYRFKKKLEHTWKSILHDGDTISVHRPKFYAQRFLEFMSQTVFKEALSLDLPEIKGPHRKFRTIVSSYIGLALKPPTKARAKSQISARQKSSSISGPSKSVTKTQNQADASRYLRTAVIKQTVNKQLATDHSNLNAENEQSTASSCASSLTSSGLGSTLRTVTWTPPHSIGTATPSHTEGTPSLTESSESEFCPTTPIRSRSSTRYSRSTLADEEPDTEVKLDVNLGNANNSATVPVATLATISEDDHPS